MQKKKKKKRPNYIKKAFAQQRPGMLEFIGSLRIGHDWAIELNWELSKENHQQNEKATNLHNGRKYLQNHMADGGVSIEKYKELIQLKRKKKQLKNGQRIWIDIFAKKTYRWLTDNMKRCSVSPIISKMQIETTLIPPQICLSGNYQETRNKCWWGCGEKRVLVHCWWECK